MSIINAVNFIIIINIRLYDVHESNRYFVDFIKYKQGPLTFLDSAFNRLFNVILVLADPVIMWEMFGCNEHFKKLALGAFKV